MQIREVRQSDVLLAVGGGKCVDTVKLAADLLRKPVFTIPTIASNCAPVTKLSIMYGEDGTFEKVERVKFGSAPLLYPSRDYPGCPYSLSQGRA
ncbi:MAG: iron-containing alcohol dehydrogenase [Enterocloster sp.]